MKKSQQNVDRSCFDPGQPEEKKNNETHSREHSDNPPPEINSFLFNDRTLYTCFHSGAFRMALCLLYSTQTMMNIKYYEC